MASAATSSPRFVRISIDQGLSQSTVQAILQDHRGFLWFGTEEGLDRYDGYSFAIFKRDPGNPQSLPNDKISVLLEDRQKRLWVGSWGGLSLFDYQSEKFSSVAQIHSKVTGLVEDRDGTLWIGTQGDGLFARDPKNGRLRHFLHYSNDPNSLGTYIVSSILLDSKRRLWIGSFDAGLDRLDETNGKFIHYRADPKNPRSLSNNEIWALAQDGEGKIWIATYGGGLNVFDENGAFSHYRHSTSDRNSLRTDLLTSVFVDHAGALWCGTDGGGLARYDPRTKGFIAYINDPGDLTSLSHNVVRAIYEDKQGQLWVGTFMGGVNLLRSSRRGFTYFAHTASDPGSIAASSVASFLQDKRGRIWVGTEGGWLDRSDSASGTFVHYRIPSLAPGGPAVLCIHEDSSGRIWVGTYRTGLARFNPSSGSFVVYRHRDDAPKTIASDEIWAIEQDRGGKLWLGTNDGLDRFDPDSGVVLAHYDASSQELGHAGIRSLHFDSNGNLWIGIHGGLDLLPAGGDRFIRYEHKDADSHSLSHSFVSVVMEDHKGRIWVGTLGGGINLLDQRSGTFTQYTDFPSRDIDGMQEDASGKLWLSTDHGISRFDPDTGSTQNFDLTNGLQSLQFHLGASLKSRDGRLFFGSTDGFYKLDPEQIVLDRYAPPVVFTSVRIFNEPAQLPAPVSTLNEITLSPQDKIFSFEFAALDYSFPRHNRYSYNLEGFSDKWIGLDNKREVTFTNLDPGDYMFQVKASNSDGLWNNGSVAALRVVVQPPFWRTLWFRGFSVLLIGLMVLAAHRVRVAGLTKDIEQRKQAVYALRTSEERFSKAFHSNPSPMSITRLSDGVLIDINQSNLTLLGYEQDEVIGRNAIDLGILGFGQHDNPYKTLLAQGTVRGQELQVRTKSGKLRHILSSAEVILLGSERCILTAALDLTEHKHLENQLRESQRIEAIGRLAGGVAHDFNNLLTVIRGYSHVLQDRAHDSDLQASAKRIDEAAEHAAALTTQLLAFSRQQVLQPQIFNLSTLVLRLDHLLRRLIGEDIEMVTIAAEHLWSVKADPGQMEQVIMNLAVNARDAMPNGGKLTIESANVQLDQYYAREHAGVQPGRYVMLAVSDTGMGIDSETQAHIFEPFFTTKEMGKGTGLGLSMVYGIVKQSGGNISVYSETGRGTTFKVYLPQVDAPAEPIAVERDLARNQRGNETILLVEDDRQVRELAQTILKAEGYSVLAAENASKAKLLCQERPTQIDLLLTDVVMPGMNGRELARQIVALCPRIRVLYMSGYTTNAIVQNGELDPGTSFLQKPFTPDTLAAKVREVLDQSVAASRRTR